MHIFISFSYCIYIATINTDHNYANVLNIYNTTYYNQYIISYNISIYNRTYCYNKYIDITLHICAGNITIPLFAITNT